MAKSNPDMAEISATGEIYDLKRMVNANWLNSF